MACHDHQINSRPHSKCGLLHKMICRHRRCSSNIRLRAYEKLAHRITINVNIDKSACLEAQIPDHELCLM